MVGTMDKKLSSKEAKFIELANKRVNKVIKDLRLIANLGNKGNYSYSDEQASKVIRTLQKEVDKVKGHFRDSNKNSGDEFIL